VPTPDEQPEDYEIGHRTYLVANVAPLDVDGVRTLQVGTAIWAIAFLLLLPFYSQLADDGHLWWLWTCAAGFGLGTLGWDHCRRRRNARAAGKSAASGETHGTHGAY
jgi:hypothetical protein